MTPEQEQQMLSILLAKYSQPTKKKNKKSKEAKKLPVNTDPPLTFLQGFVLGVLAFITAVAFYANNG